MKYLLDTNVISELISKKPSLKVISFINSIDENDLYLSVITIGEIKSGIAKLEKSMKKEQLNLWLENELLFRFKNRIIDVDIDIMMKWGELNSYLKKIGKPLPIMDSFIGATCKTKNLILVTRNEKDFKNIDIKIFNPF